MKRIQLLQSEKEVYATCGYTKSQFISKKEYKLKTLSVNTVSITETEVGYEEKIIVLTICLSVLQLKEPEWFTEQKPLPYHNRYDGGLYYLILFFAFESAYNYMKRIEKP